ncbi:hypothetical protein N657DRAFT_647598 [Parathielavia appendiculata]|uniref:Uncharacterized protein n=1 Tax=Parathielavia appendiculata TaxID=2587402 RepID=A0AAN6TWZ7_9PEZI|nr:hypothetical protein N657DRAFT_647598 [Parathielavia appendiculata]
MDIPTMLMECLCGPNDAQPNQPVRRNYTLIREKPPFEPFPSTDPSSAPTDDDLTRLTNKILVILLQSPAPAPCTDLTPQVIATTGVTTNDWSSYLAERLLHALEDTLNGDHSTWGEAITVAYNRAVDFLREELHALWEYAQEHPYEIAAEVVLTMLALGVLARLVPVFVRVLGFAELGPVEASFAAWWQQLYGGYVPKGSVFSFLQRMGMTW